MAGRAVPQDENFLISRDGSGMLTYILGFTLQTYAPHSVKKDMFYG
jgi:hypothetical protein